MSDGGVGGLSWHLGAVASVEAEATLDLTGSVTIAVGQTLSVDTISEKGSGTGVTIDGLLIKDGGIGENLTVTGNILVDGASTRNIGSTSAEIANIYIGTGRLYLGAGQETSIYNDSGALGVGNILNINAYDGANEGGEIFLHSPIANPSGAKPEWRIDVNVASLRIFSYDGSSYVTDLNIDRANDVVTTHGDLIVTPLAGGGDRYVYVDNTGKLIAGAAYP